MICQAKQSIDILNDDILWFNLQTYSYILDSLLIIKSYDLLSLLPSSVDRFLQDFCLLNHVHVDFSVGCFHHYFDCFVLYALGPIFSWSRSTSEAHGTPTAVINNQRHLVPPGLRITGG